MPYNRNQYLARFTPGKVRLDMQLTTNRQQAVTIATQTLLNIWRKHNNLGFIYVPDVELLFELELENYLAFRRPPWQELQHLLEGNRLLLPAVNECVQRLHDVDPEAYRVLGLRRTYGVSPRRIAVLMGYQGQHDPVGRVNEQLDRARQFIANCLQRRGF